MQDSFGVPEIHPDEIEMEQLIGEGTYGQVFSGRCRGKEVAVKVFKESMIRSHEDLQSIRDEVSTMSRIYHPNVVLFMGACAIPGKSLMIVTEKMPTDLDTLLIKKKTFFTLYKKLRMAKDAALGMNWLHSSDPVFIHRDLKLSNLLVDQNYKVCVCDFGLTQAKPKDVSNLEYDPHGSPLYMAPEVFFGDYNEKCDIYSFGIGLWEMITQKEAFEEINGNLAQFVEAVCYNDYRPPIPDGVPSSLVKLMNRCWAKDARSRPSMSEIVQELDLVAIDSAIQDEHGRKLWKSLFRDKEEVDWNEFKEGICDYLSIPDPQQDDQRFKCLEAILASKPQTLKNSSIEKVVNIEKFGNTCQWFGPFKTAGDSSALLNKLSSILSEKWFHGEITQDQAEDRLRDQEKGTFLIRFSSAPGFFTLSLLTKKKILHQRIEHTGDGYIFGEEKYSSMANLIKEQRKKLSLVQPCSGSPYRKLFPSSKGKPQVDIGAYVAPVGKK